MKSLFFLAAILGTSMAFAQGPCDGADRLLGGSGKAPLQALHDDVNVVKGTEKNMASCVLDSDPQVTACLSTAATTYQNGTFVVLNLQGPADNAVLKQTFGTFISSTDSGASVDLGDGELHAKESFLNGGRHRLGGSDGGYKSEINLDGSSLRFRHWTSTSSSFIFANWQLDQDLQFTCQLQ